MNREKQILTVSYCVAGLLAIPMLAWSVASGPVIVAAKLEGPTPQATPVVIPAVIPAAVPKSPPLLLSATWPPAILQWSEPISMASEVYSLDPDLIAAVIMMESGGNAEAHGGSGEYGLMQIMPYHSCVSWDPAQNIDCGAQILSRLIERADGSKSLGLAAYNAGETGRDRDGKGLGYANTVLTLYRDAKEVR